MKPIKKDHKDDYVLELFHDEHPHESPLEYSEVMTVGHSHAFDHYADNMASAFRIILNDISSDKDLSCLAEDVTGHYIGWNTIRHKIHLDKSPWNEIQVAFREHVHDYIHLLPLYKYEHSGVSYSVKPFKSIWDSGQIGYVYLSKDEFEDSQRARQRIDAAIKEFSSWANGEVYRWQVKHQKDGFIDGCGGYIGDHEYVWSEGERNLTRIVSEA